MYYLKCLDIDENRNLSSCHGGAQVWKLGKTIEISEPNRSQSLCREGIIHLCRLRDLPNWLSTHLVLVEVKGTVIEGPDKVGAYCVTPVKTIEPVGCDGLELVCRFAEECARLAKGDKNNDFDSEIVKWLVAQYPVGSFDEVVK